MGWFTDVSNKVKGIWHHNTTAKIANYSYQAIAYGFEQVAAIPRVARSIVTHPPTRTVIGHLWHISFWDLMPMFLVYGANQYVQTNGPAYIASKFDIQPPKVDEPNDGWPDPNVVIIQGSFFLVATAAWIFHINRNLEFMARMQGGVNLEATPMFRGAKRSVAAPATCVDNCPPTLKGPISNLAGFWVAGGFISLTGYIPVVGELAAFVLGWYHNGHYILTLATPELCNDHLAIYLRENPELSLSLGLGHWGTTKLVSTLAESATGIPAQLYADALRHLTLITQVSVAMHLDVPTAHKTSTRVRDPLLLVQDGVDLLVEIIISGAKKILPQKFDRSDPENFKEMLRHLLPWATLSRLGGHIHHNRLVRNILPPILRDTQSLVRDKIISSSWPTIQPTIVDTLKIIESLPEYRAVQVVGFLALNPVGLPNVIVERFYGAIEKFSGVPKCVSKLTLVLITDPEIIALLQSLRFEIEKLHVGESRGVIVDANAPLLPGQSLRARTLPSSIKTSPSLPPSKNVIRLQNRTSPEPLLPAAETVVRRPAAKDKAVNPASVIRHRFLAPKTTSTSDSKAQNGLEDDWIKVDEDEVTLKAIAKQSSVKN